MSVGQGEQDQANLKNKSMSRTIPTRRKKEKESYREKKTERYDQGSGASKGGGRKRRGKREKEGNEQEEGKRVSEREKKKREGSRGEKKRPMRLGDRKRDTNSIKYGKTEKQLAEEGTLCSLGIFVQKVHTNSSKHN